MNQTYFLPCPRTDYPDILPAFAWTPRTTDYPDILAPFSTLRHAPRRTDYPDILPHRKRHCPLSGRLFITIVRTYFKVGGASLYIRIVAIVRAYSPSVHADIPDMNKLPFNDVWDILDTIDRTYFGVVLPINRTYHYRLTGHT
jgi:hypothetical protein